MKKLFLRILPFALIMFTLITFIACNDRSENDDTSTDITVTVPGSGGNDDQEQENGNGGEDKGDPDFATDGSNGMVMVETPIFYQKYVETNDYIEYWLKTYKWNKIELFLIHT